MKYLLALYNLQPSLENNLRYDNEKGPITITGNFTAPACMKHYKLSIVVKDPIKNSCTTSCKIVLAHFLTHRHHKNSQRVKKYFIILMGPLS